MLVLHVKSMNAQQQERSFDCWLNELETALDTLSLIAAAGTTFLEIYILEDGQRTTLSPQAFDGQNLTKPLQKLQQQWEAQLALLRPKPRPLTVPPLWEMMLDRIDQYESLMAQADQWFTDGFQKHRLLTHYRSIVTRHYQSMGRAQTHRDQCLKKLTQLKSAHSG